jgi:divinyl protochlorophyllide a 8-vinyl-reductase
MSLQHASLAAAPRALIGPNAVTQVAAALDRHGGPALTARVFAQAALSRHLSRPPTEMVDEAEVVRLHEALRNLLGTSAARSVSADAGRRTGDYLLASRIPRPVQWLLKRLPATMSGRILLAAIRRHAWTFTGAGSFSAHAAGRGQSWRLTIRNGPLARGLRSREPVCDFYAATFERLFRVLVHPDARALESACEATGADACVFELRWHAR